MSACDHCAKPVKGEEDSITCMAFCDRMVHMKCTGSKTLNKPFLKIVLENPNLVWMCDECAKLMKMARFKSAVSSFGDVINTITEKQESVHSEIRRELERQGQQIALLSKRITSSTPVLLESGGFSGQPSLKRRRGEDLTPNKPLVGGTKVVADVSVLTVPEPVELFWLYLSRIHPSVKPDAVEMLAKDCLQTNDPIKAIPLVKRGTDTSRMRFISYKIGIDPKLRDVSLDSSTWPKGILFREFEDNSSKNLWLPRLQTPSIVVSPEPGLSQFSTPVSGIDLTMQ